MPHGPGGAQHVVLVHEGSGGGSSSGGGSGSVGGHGQPETPCRAFTSAAVTLTLAIL